MAGLASSTYHFWRVKFDDPAYIEEDPRIAIVAAAFDAAGGLYGHRRVRRMLQDQGIFHSRKTVNKLLKQAGRHCQLRRKRFHTAQRGKRYATCENIVDRDFHREAPNMLWLTDLTAFHVAGRLVYLSAIKDVYNGEIVAHSISASPSPGLVVSTFKQALKGRLIGTDLIVHSDQGVQYTSRSFVGYLEEAGITQSMSRKGNCLDNAPMESFFGHMKDDLGRPRQFETLEELTETIQEYIYYYNYQRRQERLGGMSPIQFRNHHYPPKPGILNT